MGTFDGNNIWSVIERSAEPPPRTRASGPADVQQLRERLDRLILICKASFELLQETTGVSERQLVERIVEIDLRDGNVDGKMTPQQKRCPSCGAGICAKFSRCLFCGHIDTTGDAFHMV
jgi:uncharacterized protein with PIN domain